jgi:hypothetical protein
MWVILISLIELQKIMPHLTRSRSTVWDGSVTGSTLLIWRRSKWLQVTGPWMIVISAGVWGKLNRSILVKFPQFPEVNCIANNFFHNPEILNHLRISCLQCQIRLPLYFVSVTHTTSSTYESRDRLVHSIYYSAILHWTSSVRLVTCLITLKNFLKKQRVCHHLYFRGFQWLPERK